MIVIQQMYTDEISPCYLSLFLVESQMKEKFSLCNLEHTHEN